MFKKFSLRWESGFINICGATLFLNYEDFGMESDIGHISFRKGYNNMKLELNPSHQSIWQILRNTDTKNQY